MQPAHASTANRLTTKDFPSFDVRRFWREARTTWMPGARAVISLSDSSTSIAMFSKKSDARPNVFYVKLDHLWSCLYLDWTPAGFDGVRVWAKCQQCAGRNAMLYLRDGKLRCRTCLGLRYPSQQKRA